MARRRASPPLIALEDLRKLLNRRPADEAAWRQVLSEDCRVRIGNDPPAVERVKGLCALINFLDRTEAIGVTFWESCREGVALYVESEAMCRDEQARKCDIPCCIVFRPIDRQFQDVRVYIDATRMPTGAGSA